ncbi:MAG: hypothetical protein AEth_01084 [Candidatus Argoarchaeum ethanivorans]|uniref:Uncharacterized protein n=1 Tax=Candidatus Argoarchaeum ethanivorans TaxID=2608793 RepID=A0A8B3S126_9EURY|nr:MAG: hypothetical protein AEth_01084 [Candidatus Argoarchaeum ethanivorans]
MLKSDLRGIEIKMLSATNKYSIMLKSDLRGIKIHHGDRFPVKNQHYLVISKPEICFPLNRQTLIVSTSAV